MWSRRERWVLAPGSAFRPDEEHRAEFPVQQTGHGGEHTMSRSKGSSGLPQPS